MTTELELVGKTQTGNLDFNVAAGICYLPVSFLHLIAALVFLVAEPKEHRFVRFHAVQSGLIFAVFIGGAFAALILGMLVIPGVLMLLGSIIGAILMNLSEDLGALVTVIFAGISMLFYFGGALLSIILSMGFLPAMIVTGALAFSGSEARWPVLGNLALKFV